MDRANNAVNPAGLPPGRQGLSRVVATSSFAAATADESRAAEIGRDILANGGNATDAAVAMYFALAVTLPSAASLGASGACIVHDDKSKQAESFVFAPVAAPGPIKGASFSVPNGVRAVTLMHVRHGSSRWEAVVAPAERLARFDIHPSGPLWGSGELRTQGAARALEAAALDDDEAAALRAGLERAGLEQERRALRLRPADLAWDRPAPDALRLRFALPPGAYATTVLAELGELEGAAGG